MKQKIILLIAAIALLTLPVHAGLQVTTINGGTNNIAGATTRTYAGSGEVFAAHNSTSLGVFISFNVISAGTSNNVVQFSSSLDNSNWSTNAALMTITSTGAATVRTNFNITTGGIPFWRVESFQNVNVAAVTNIVISGFTKPGI